ncbi:MAG: 50S ribosomal protein L21 [Deltaproteobacteria bacterium]|nr:50S ribosomal protein L21 [Deltaproteobacteria bacterium]MBI4373807.1 50S ribosomal protein L21 [Deltaproteobacteria bacterium]
MYAIIQSGGKQYRVSKGDRVVIEKIPLEAGKEISFDEVLFLGGEDGGQVGTPRLETAHVLGRVVAQQRGEKVIVYKYKRRKGYDKKRGHRQEETVVEITDIKGGGS